MNTDGHELELSSAREDSSFYTRRQDGVSGMNVTALSQFCGVDQPVITELLNKLRDSSTLGNNLPASLKPFAGIEQRIIGNQDEKSLYVKDELCHAILEYYALDARKYKGKQIAQDNYRMVAKAGLRVFIWSQTGYTPSTTSALTQQQADLIALIPGLIETVTQLQAQVQNLLPQAPKNTIPPGWDLETWNNQPPQDKRHFRYLYRRRNFRPSDQGVNPVEPVVEKIITSAEIKARANQEIQAAIGEISQEEKERLEAAKQKALEEFRNSQE